MVLMFNYKLHWFSFWLSIFLSFSSSHAFVGDVIDEFTDQLFGKSFENLGESFSKGAADEFRDLAIDLLSRLEILADKELDRSDEIVDDFLRQLRKILNQADEDIDDAIAKLQKLETDLFIEIDEVFVQIYDLLAEGQCTVTGILAETELVVGNIVDDLNVLEQLRQFIRRERDVIEVAEVYEEGRRILESRLTEDAAVQDIINTYVDLIFHSRRMECLFRTTEARVLYRKHFLEYEQRLAIWLHVAVF